MLTLEESTKSPDGASDSFTPAGLRLHHNPMRQAMLARAIDTLVRVGPTMARISPLRRWMVNLIAARLQSSYERTKVSSERPVGVERDRLDMSLAVVDTVARALGEQRLCAATLRGTMRTLVKDVLIQQGSWAVKEEFRARNGSYPPDFLLISPGKACNLRCTGCYADAGPTPEKLPWATFNRLVSEASEQWGARFFVISGGEPLAYHSEGKGVLDLAEQHPECFFLMFTNGTLINDDTAHRLATLGNITPALSVEGLRARTDERRGAGTFERIVAAMDRLKREKVLFGISMTATRTNADEILSDESVDFFFHKQQALYGWIFHYMPIGRSFTLDLMPTPEQRQRLWRRTWQLVREQRLFLADFWNSGTVSDGCVSAGRTGGYLYIDWNGAVSPCAFVPYSPINICAAYQDGKTLNDVWAEPFFASMRAWQSDYGFHQPRSERQGNWLTPCPIRDHYGEFRQLLATHEPDPTDDNARQALLDEDYARGLEAYDKALETLTGPVWEADYLRSDRAARAS